MGPCTDCGTGGNGSGVYFGIPTLRLSWGGFSFPVAKRVIFSGPATIVLWNDGTKTVVKCGEGDEFNHETGIALFYMKKALGNKGNYNNTMKRLLKEAKEC